MEKITRADKIKVAARAMAKADGYRPNEVTTIPIDTGHPMYRWQHYEKLARAAVVALERR